MQVRRYADHLLAYSSSYGPDAKLTVEQRYTRDALRECGEIVTAILDGEEWALRE